MKKIGIGIVGLGNIGSRLYKEILSKKNDIGLKTNTKISIIGISAKNFKKKRSFKVKKNIFYKNSIISNAGINFDNLALENSLKEIRESNNKIDENKIHEKILADIEFYNTEKEIEDAPVLNAKLIEKLFKDEGYSLKKVRQNKVVNIGISIPRLPKEIKNIQNVKKKKELFLEIVLPLILEENAKIRVDRIKFFSILNKKYNSKTDKEWLIQKLDQYGVKNNDLSTLKIRMDEVPASLALAQAAKETGWGTSRFAQEGNALFGQWTWAGDGIKPSEADKDTTHKVAKFKILKSSVRAYLRNLNTHSSYLEFRKERAIQRDNDESLNSFMLVNYLNKYAETGNEYVKILKKIIEQNSLTDFDDVKILPTSLKLKKLI